MKESSALKIILKIFFPKTLTKRIALKICHSVFDPVMLIQPWIHKSRLLFRDILIHEKTMKNHGWDEPLPEKFRCIWLNLCKEMFELETLQFDRSLVPKGYNPNVDPTLV